MVDVCFIMYWIDLQLCFIMDQAVGVRLVQAVERMSDTPHDFVKFHDTDGMQNVFSNVTGHS